VKLVMAIIHDEDAYEIIDLLNSHGYSATKLASTGGFLRAGNTTLICGAEEEKVDELIKLIESKCESRKRIMPVNPAGAGAGDGYVPFPVEVVVGGATIFVLGVERFKKV